MSKVRDFNYGFLNSQKKPTPLKFNSSKLGNNGTQLYTIITHFPLIFRNYRTELQEIWPNMIALLKCMQVAFSTTIRECDILRLITETENHLQGIIDIFKKDLIPKHHLLTHHPNIIRDMGPLVKMWMIRYESKHKVFSDMAKRTHNFVNIAQTLAQKHQEMFCLKGFDVNNTIEDSKTRCYAYENEELNEHKQILLNFKLDKSLVLNFLNLNCWQYRKGVILMVNSLAYRIKFVLKKDDNYFFICEVFDKIEFREYFNAIELKQSGNNEDIQVLKLSEISNKASYQQHFINGQVFVLCNTLDVFNKF